MSSKYFHKNGHFTVHVADKFCLFYNKLQEKLTFKFSRKYEYDLREKLCENAKTKFLVLTLLFLALRLHTHLTTSPTM
jgi:hypothetical protein